MDFILEELEKKKCYKSVLKTQCRKNSIDPSYANCFTIVKLRKYFQKPPQIEQSQKPRLKSSVWLQNELKAYQWLLICLSAVRNLLIRDFKSQLEWQQLSAIFGKEESVLQYEAVKLINQKQGFKRKWQPQESILLEQIVKGQPDNNKWNEIARTLFDSSQNKWFRTGKQCRERWLNHLDPNKKKGQWQQNEDRFIAKFILERGKKWSQIAKQLEFKRTQHMIKNRYKTIIIKLKKEFPHLKHDNHLLKGLLQRPLRPQRKEEEQEHLQIEQQEQQLNLQDLPVEDGEFQIREQEVMDRINPSTFKQFELQQAVTPCPIIYQSFTPTFLNTPHALPFFCSFGKVQKSNDNLFLRNN